MAVATTYSGVWDAGAVTHAGPFSQAVDLAGASLLVVVVTWNNVSEDFPLVTYGGATVLPVGAPRVVDAGLGSTTAVFALKAPAAGSNTLHVGVSFSLGNTVVAAVGISGDAGLLGARWSVDESAEAFPPVGADPDKPTSLLLVAAAEWFWNATITPSAGWTGLATGGVAGRHLHLYTAPGSANPLELTADSSTNLMILGVEIYEAGETLPAGPVTVEAYDVLDYGILGDTSVTHTIAVAACDLLVLVLGSTGKTLPKVTVNDVPCSFVDQLVFDAGDGMVAILPVPHPGAGTISINLSGYSGYRGANILGALALSGVTGQVPARAFHYESAPFVRTDLTGTEANSGLFGFVTTLWQGAGTPGMTWGWSALANTQGESISMAVFAGPPPADGTVEVISVSEAAYPAQCILLMDFAARPEAASNLTATATLQMLAPSVDMTATNVGKLAPDGQVFDVYCESWLEKNLPASPDLLYLTHVPKYVRYFILSFAEPLITYTGLEDNVAATTSVRFNGTGHQFKAALDLLRARNPGIQIMLSVQQSTVDAWKPEPYDPTGWGGLTEAHMLATRRFCEDMGIYAIDIDYETFSQNLDPTYHCWTAEDGERHCYHDAELLSVIKLYREYFPRPDYYITAAPPHVGAYFGVFANETPVGWNSGYMACVKRDPEALAALDGLHIQTYDAGATFNPLRAFAAYQHHFPTLELFMGLRTGSPEWEGVHRSYGEMAEMLNFVIRKGGKGAFMYSLLGGVMEHPGDVTRAWPDGNMAAQLTAWLYDLPEATKPLASDGGIGAGAIFVPRLT